MIIGEIYNFNNSKVRIIQFDEIEVFYEPWNEHVGEWYFSKTKTLIFFRAPRRFFTSNAELLENENRDEKGLERFHTQLPMRLNRFENLQWESEPKLDFKTLASNDLHGIDADSIVIFPSLQSGKLGKSEIIKERIRDGVKLMEIAFTIQAPYIKDKDSRFILTTLAKEGKNHQYFDGIGIYRLGLKGNVPSYYIGGYNDFARNTEYENTPNIN